MTADLIAEARNAMVDLVTGEPLDAGAFAHIAVESLSALLARLEAAEAKLARMEEALIWCSGSEDFQDGGYAREGWLNLCAPLIHAALQGEG